MPDEIGYIVESQVLCTVFQVIIMIGFMSIAYSVMVSYKFRVGHKKWRERVGA